MRSNRHRLYGLVAAGSLALAGALVKNEQDVQLLERLAFMSRRGNR